MSHGMTKPNLFVYHKVIISSSIWSDQLQDMNMCQSQLSIISFIPLLIQYKSKTIFRLIKYRLAKNLVINLIEWNVDHNLLLSKSDESFINHSQPSYDS